MNHIQFSQQRDREIVRVVAQGGALTRRQLEQIICPGQKAATRIIQRRVNVLTKCEQLKKYQRVSYEPYVYFIKKPRNIYHTLLVNDVYCALTAQKPKLYRLDFEWEYSIMSGRVIADAMITIYTDPDRKHRQVVWLEVERSPSRRFDKVDKYSAIFVDKWAGEPWAVVKDGKAYFPTVLIVTDETLKVNVEKPKFVVANTERVQKGIYELILRGELL